MRATTTPKRALGFHRAAQKHAPTATMARAPKAVRWSELMPLGMWAASQRSAWVSMGASKLSWVRVAGLNEGCGMTIAIRASWTGIPIVEGECRAGRRGIQYTAGESSQPAGHLVSGFVSERWRLGLT